MAESIVVPVGLENLFGCLSIISKPGKEENTVLLMLLILRYYSRLLFIESEAFFTSGSKCTQRFNPDCHVLIGRRILFSLLILSQRKATSCFERTGHFLVSISAAMI